MPSGDQATHYEVLGVAPDASGAEIRQAFQRLAREHHPDRNRGDRSATARMAAVNAAYAVLRNPRRREEYDQQLAEESPRGVVDHAAAARERRRREQEAERRRAREAARKAQEDAARERLAQERREREARARKARLERERQEQLAREHEAQLAQERELYVAPEPQVWEPGVATEGAPKEGPSRSCGAQLGCLFGGAVGWFVVIILLGLAVSETPSGEWETGPTVLWMFTALSLGFAIVLGAFGRPTSDGRRVIAWGIPFALSIGLLITRFAS